jgi:hypothetical protein
LRGEGVGKVSRKDGGRGVVEGEAREEREDWKRRGEVVGRDVAYMSLGG